MQKEWSKVVAKKIFYLYVDQRLIHSLTTYQFC